MKITLILISLAMIVMGILGAIPAINIGTEPMWHAIVKIIIGLVGLYVAWKAGKE
ncbi:hypothetical protein ACFLXP_02505 [Chloroflexota bacterium]